MIYFGAGNISSPLGSTTSENWRRMISYESEIKPYDSLRPEDPKLFLSRFKDSIAFNERIKECVNHSLLGIQREKLDWTKTILIFSTTKADVEQLENRNIEKALLDSTNAFLLQHFPAAQGITVSNACISGITALILAHDLIATKQYENALVIAGDNCSTFVSEGFKSFYAIAPNFCKPYDTNREGINLGEGVASAFVSSNVSLFNDQPVLLHGGASANDANHISGPSRTGEGLFRATERALKLANKTAADIDYISAHGTATRYNDDMESVALQRLGLQKTPLNSLKGYIGHTLGAAGLIETLIAVQQMKKDTVLATKGFEEPGTVEEINVFSTHQQKTLRNILKNGSGFGGCNAAIILEKLT